MAKLTVLGVVVIVCVCLGLVYTAPAEQLTNNKDDMAEKFVEFLKQDTELSNLLTHGSFSQSGLLRNRRANSMDDVETVDDPSMNPNTEGFFDRAAKFVMEVLQRFLRWINTDD